MTKHQTGGHWCQNINGQICEGIGQVGSGTLYAYFVVTGPATSERPEWVTK